MCVCAALRCAHQKGGCALLLLSYMLNGTWKSIYGSIVKCCVCVCALIVAILFLFLSFPALQTHTGKMGCTWKEKTKITKTTTTAPTTATHSIQGKAAQKQVFKFIVRHHYSLIRLGSGFCFFGFIFACSLQKNVMSAWGTIFRICAHSMIEREFFYRSHATRMVSQCADTTTTTTTKSKCVTDKIEETINNIGIIITKNVSNKLHLSDLFMYRISDYAQHTVYEFCMEIEFVKLRCIDCCASVRPSVHNW